MRKIGVFLCIVLIIVGFCACSGTQSASQGKSGKLVFADEIFEDYIRQLIGKMEGELTYEDIAGIKQIKLHTTELGISYQSYDSETNSSFSTISIGTLKELVDGEVDIPKTLEDLRYFTELEYLRIPYIPVKNLDFAANMPNLKYLDITDAPAKLAPLASCTQLEYLKMDFQQVSDFSPLEKLEHLKTIELYKCSELLSFMQEALPGVEIRN